MNYEDIKNNMIAEKYRTEQNLTRLKAIEACPAKNLALELYAGTGALTEFYKIFFKAVITNDINPNSVAQFKMSASKFLETNIFTTKIDMIDFDCYGSPSNEIKQFFALYKNDHCPLVLTLSDGLGIWMKRSKNIQKLRERYLIPELLFDERHPWREHQRLIREFMCVLARKYEMKVKEIISVQTKHKNYVLATYLFTK